ncbi:polyphosphate kinase [Sphingosinicella sp. LHD-64]|uniref:polyphosphate kinase 2 family protein n=1 Tax=Sphingosinicella sp. LHD-64 TaxID=3072139 RepID=UPI00280FC04B|nr:polyphosphate kinase [Sphingosinicella sp. LHD-64]MDQ8754864.1 polyphosphate kinase [Sphingosinicella sp. LHD-64]
MTIDLGEHESGANYEGDYETDLEALQERLSRLFVTADVHRKKAIIAVEGWDAAGKGGAIQRLTATCDPRTYKVWPISAPALEEKARHYLWRFWTRLPEAGEVAIFDRTWYGRVLVERVEGFATEAEWKRAYDEINEFEAQLAADGTILIKLFFHVTQETQDKRLRARLDDPWKHWKVGPEDLRNRARRDDYTKALKDMFERTDTRWAPWTVIDGNNKKAARIAALTQVADTLAAALPKKPPPIRPDLAQSFREALGDGD